MAQDLAPIEFISGEELREIAKAEHAQELANSADGLLAEMNLAFEELGGMERMKAWAEEHYTEFMKLRARLALANKEKKSSVRILIGLPRSPLDQ